MRSFVNPRPLLCMAAIWFVSLAIIVSPGGVITQIWEADRRLDKNLAASPLGKLCYVCSGPAVSKVEYNDGSVRYFCERHPPPERVQSTVSGEHGSKGFSPEFCIFLLLGIYGINTLRVLIHIVKPWREYIPTVKGALLGLVGVGGAWWWFASR